MWAKKKWQKKRTVGVLDIVEEKKRFFFVDVVANSNLIASVDLFFSTVLCVRIYKCMLHKRSTSNGRKFIFHLVRSLLLLWSSIFFFFSFFLASSRIAEILLHHSCSHVFLFQHFGISVDGFILLFCCFGVP